MADEDGQPNLRVDRLAMAMDAARARARGEDGLTAPARALARAAARQTAEADAAASPQPHGSRRHDPQTHGARQDGQAHPQMPSADSGPPARPPAEATPATGRRFKPWRADGRSMGGVPKARPGSSAAPAEAPSRAADGPPEAVEGRPPAAPAASPVPKARVAAPAPATRAAPKSSAAAPAVPGQPASRRLSAPARPLALGPDLASGRRAPAGSVPRPDETARGLPPFLAVRGLSAAIGGRPVLDSVDLAVAPGGVTALLGRDGAGKSTLLRAVMGLAPITGGEIRLGGVSVGGRAPDRIARAGVGYVPREGGVFGGLTVAENLRLGARAGPVPQDRLDWLFRVFPALLPLWRQRADDLGPGERQMLAVARVLVDRRRLYLFDEPARGLDDGAADRLASALRDLKLQGATVLLADAALALAAPLAAHGVLLEGGSVVWSGALADLAADPDLLSRLAKPGDDGT